MARHWWKKVVAKQSTCLKYLNERPSLSITLHSHIGHNKLPTWLTGGQVNAFLQKFERLGTQYLFSENGQLSRALHEKRVTNNKGGGMIKRLAELKRSVVYFGRVQYWLMWPKTQKHKSRSQLYQLLFPLFHIYIILSYLRFIEVIDCFQVSFEVDQFSTAEKNWPFFRCCCNHGQQRLISSNWCW